MRPCSRSAPSMGFWRGCQQPSMSGRSRAGRAATATWPRYATPARLSPPIVLYPCCIPLRELAERFVCSAQPRCQGCSCQLTTAQQVRWAGLPAAPKPPEKVGPRPHRATSPGHCACLLFSLQACGMMADCMTAFINLDLYQELDDLLLPSLAHNPGFLHAACEHVNSENVPPHFLNPRPGLWPPRTLPFKVILAYM